MEVCVAIRSADTDRLTSAIRDHPGKSTLRVLPPGSDDYAGATRIWNGAVTHEPLLIAQCFNANDARQGRRSPYRTVTLQANLSLKFGQAHCGDCAELRMKDEALIAIKPRRHR
jgi:hypothetical protein